MTTYTEDPAEALARAAPFLETRPVEHNLILTLLNGRLARPLPGRYWIVGEGPDVVGLVFQSPHTFPATMTPMSSDAVAAAVDAVCACGVRLPGITGEAATAARFAGEWTERTNAAARPVGGQRLYRLDALESPPPARGG